MPRIVRTIAILIGVFCAAVLVGLGGLSLITHQNPLRVIARAVIPSAEQVFGKDHLLVLVVGLDYDYSSSDIESSKSSRSDIIKTIDLDFATKKIYVLSVPRDMDAILPDGQEAKINQAQADGGIKESQAVIARWLGIPGFDRYVILRIDTMKDLINAIDGVDVDVKNSDALTKRGPNGPVNYDDNWGHLHVHLQPGLQHLDGSQAVGYSRFRHDWCSDPCRIMRQDQVMRAIVARLKGDKLNTLGHIGQLLSVVGKDVETSFTTREELSLADAFSNIGPHAIVTAQVPYVGDKMLPDYGDVIIPDTVARAHFVQTMLLDPPRPSAAQSGAAAAAPSIRVDVENGTSSKGLAGRLASTLKAKGFAIGTVGNATVPNVVKTEILTSNVAAGIAVRNALGNVATSLPIVPDGSADVSVIVGQDFATRF